MAKPNILINLKVLSLTFNSMAIGKAIISPLIQSSSTLGMFLPKKHDNLQLISLILMEMWKKSHNNVALIALDDNYETELKVQ